MLVKNTSRGEGLQDSEGAVCGPDSSGNPFCGFGSFEIGHL